MTASLTGKCILFPFKSFDMGVSIVHILWHFIIQQIWLFLLPCVVVFVFMLLILSVIYVTQHEGGAILLLSLLVVKLVRMLLLVVMYVAQYQVGAMMFLLLIIRLPSFVVVIWWCWFWCWWWWCMWHNMKRERPSDPPPALVWWSAQLRKRRCRADLQRTMQRWWNYAKGNWEESPLSLIEDPSLRPRAHFFRRLLNLGSSNLRDQNRGNEGKTRNAIGMLWRLQPLVSHYSKLLIVLHCKPSLNGVPLESDGPPCSQREEVLYRHLLFVFVYHQLFAIKSS